MKKIKIAQIGTSQNSHGNDIWNTLKRLSDIFEIVGYALPENEEEKFKNRMADFDGYKKMSVEQILSDNQIEAVTIETEEIYLTKYALMAAKSSKHIHMEKPGGVALADFEELIKIMKSTGKVFHTGYMYRYNPYITELMQSIKNGELGEIISVEAQMNCIHPKNTRQWLENFPGGMMFFLGCHLIDLVLQIKGKPEKIIPYNRCSGLDGVTAKDFGMAVFEYKNGVSFVKTSAAELGGFERRQLVVTGSKATVELKPLEWYVPGTADLQTHRSVRTCTDWNQKTAEEICAPCNRYDTMMKSFAEYIREIKQNPFTLDYESELYKTVLKCCGK